MSSEINLLTDLQARNRLARRNLWRFLIFSLVLAFTVLVVWAWFWSSSIVLKRQDAILNANLDSLQSQIKSQTQIEQRQILLIDRLNSISGLLAKRPKLAERLTKVTNLFPSDVVITSVELSGTADKLTVGLSAATYQSFVQSIQILQKSDVLAVVTLKGTDRKADGTYNLTLEIKDQ